MKIRRYCPIVVFLVFFILLIGMILYYMPPWGLRDDAQNLGRAQEIWQSENILQGLYDSVKDDLLYWGMFRPVYYVWIAFTYHFFKDIPWFIYIIISICNMFALLLWGVVISGFFSVTKEEAPRGIFLFPLSFFIFTPFWNIFFNISFQEKFVFIFSVLSLYFLKKAYDKGKPIFLVQSMFFMILGVLGKSTAIHLAIIYIIFAFLDLVFLKYRKVVSLWLLIINSIIFYGYYRFITPNLRIYTAQYKLNLNHIIGNLLHTPVLIKFLMAVALLEFVYMFIALLRRKNNYLPLAILVPLGFLSYILVLAPWYFVNYLLSPLAPYALSMFFPFYLWLNRKKGILKSLTNFSLVTLVATVFFMIAVPRVSKLADIGKVESYIRASNKNNNYFFPPPFEESARAVACFTSAQVIYIKDRVLSSEELDSQKENYLIVNDEASPITLNKVRVDKLIHSNNTWRIFRLVRDDSNTGLFEVSFPLNYVEKLKILLQNL